MGFEPTIRHATEVRGFESHLGLGFFPRFPLMQKTYHVLLLILLVLQETVSRSYITLFEMVTFYFHLIAT